MRSRKTRFVGVIDLDAYRPGIGRKRDSLSPWSGPDALFDGLVLQLTQVPPPEVFGDRTPVETPSAQSLPLKPPKRGGMVRSAVARPGFSRRPAAPLESDLQQLVEELHLQLDRLQHRVDAVLDDAQRTGNRPSVFGW
ncbi:MAG: hypothetical protein ACYC35_01310 [Pirellulales bacterium]